VRKTFVMAAVAAGGLVLAGCSSGGGGSASGGGAAPSPAAAGNSVADLKTFSSPLGAVVVDGKSMTAYAFDKDTVGSSTSACTGTCTSLWFPVTTTSDTPAVQGVTGMVGTAPTADGGKQVTLAGHRLYTFSGDSSSGQLNGQAFMNLWWVVTPGGQEVKKTAAAAPTTPSSAGGYTY
jgi:predicted lipoprotein with Yx(FWY)xxD motif